MNKKIQVLRGLAIIAVVMIHTNIGGLMGVINRPFLNYSVATFIFLSGYLTKLNIINIKEFYKKRLTRVLVPYLIWSIIYTVAYGKYNGFILDLLTGRCCFAYYFIFIYSLLVLLTPVISKMILSKYSWVGWIVTPVSLLITRYIPSIFQISLSARLSSFLVTNWFVYYYIGLYLGNEKVKFKISIVKKIIFNVFCLLFSLLEGIAWFTFGNYDMATTQLRFTSMLTSISFIFLIYEYLILNREQIFNNKIDRACKNILICIGNCSFGIYLSHILIMGVLNRLTIFNKIPFPLCSVIVLIISTGCVLIGKKILTNKFCWVLGL